MAVAVVIDAVLDIGGWQELGLVDDAASYPTTQTVPSPLTPPAGSERLAYLLSILQTKFLRDHLFSIENSRRASERCFSIMRHCF